MEPDEDLEWSPESDRSLTGFGCVLVLGIGLSIAIVGYVELSSPADEAKATEAVRAGRATRSVKETRSAPPAIWSDESIVEALRAQGFDAKIVDVRKRIAGDRQPVPEGPCLVGGVVEVSGGWRRWTSRLKGLNATAEGTSVPVSADGTFALMLPEGAEERSVVVSGPLVADTLMKKVRCGQIEEPFWVKPASHRLRVRAVDERGRPVPRFELERGGVSWFADKRGVVEAPTVCWPNGCLFMTIYADGYETIQVKPIEFTAGQEAGERLPLIEMEPYVLKRTKKKR